MNEKSSIVKAVWMQISCIIHGHKRILTKDLGSGLAYQINEGNFFFIIYNGILPSLDFSRLNFSVDYGKLCKCKYHVLYNPWT